MSGRVLRLPGSLLKQALITRASKQWHKRFPKEGQQPATKPSAFSTTYPALEGHLMLSVLLVAALNTLGHVYCAHRHEEIDRTAAERVWNQLHYKLTQHSLANIQRSLHEWQRLLRSAEGSFAVRAAWAARQQLHQNQQHALIGYHKQQATRMQHKYLAGQYSVLAHFRHHYHSAVFYRLTAHWPGIHAQQPYEVWRDTWQKVTSQSRHQIHLHLIQQQSKTLQLTSHAFHLQYWNMQRTRRLRCVVQLPIMSQKILTVKVWSPQTSADMPRADPF